MSISELARRAGRHAPPWLLARLRRWYYRRALPRFREPDAEVVAALVSPGESVVDVGAHAGWYTRLLSERVGPGGRVTAVEPIPPTFEILRYCARALRLGNVELVNCAVSHEEGSAWMHVPDWGSGGLNFYQARLGDGAGSPGDAGFQVRVRRLDEILRDTPPPFAFLKIDVEGHELEAVDGASAILARDLPSLMIEVSDDPDDAASSAGRLFTRLEGLGYRAWWYDGRALHPRSRADSSVNYFFLQAPQLARLRQKGFPLREDPA